MLSVFTLARAFVAVFQRNIALVVVIMCVVPIGACINVFVTSSEGVSFTSAEPRRY